MGKFWNLRGRAGLLAGVAAAALALALALAPAARAEGVSDDGAKALEQQVHDWLAALLGPGLDPGERPLHISADGDRYKVELPFAGALGASGVTLEGDPATAMLTPLDGGRWALDDIRMPSPLHVRIPAQGDGKPGEMTVSVEQQDQHAVLDPTLATESHWDGTLKGYATAMTGLAGKQDSGSHMDDMSFHLSVTPTGDGLLTIVQESDGHHLTTTMQAGEGQSGSFSIGRVHGLIKLTGVAPEQVAPMIHAVTRLAPLGMAAAKLQAEAKAQLTALEAANSAAMEQDRKAAAADKQAVADGTLTADDLKKRNMERHKHAQERIAAIRQARMQSDPPKLSDADRAAAHDGLLALATLIGGFEEDGAAEDVHFGAAGHTGHLDKFAIGFGFGAPEGRATMHLAIGLDGFDSEEIPPGVYRDYLPRHVLLAQHIGGVPAEDLRALLLRASDSEGKDPQLSADALALLGKGPVVYAIDALSLDIGPATLQGKGEMHFRSTADYDGEAHLAMTGLDDLIKQANQIEELKQAAPVLLMVKGLGHQDGPTTTWDVTYKDGKLLVNGNDLGGMLPGK